jgi:hypothetical protein
VSLGLVELLSFLRADVMSSRVRLLVAHSAMVLKGASAAKSPAKA